MIESYRRGSAQRVDVDGRQPGVEGIVRRGVLRGILLALALAVAVQGCFSKDPIIYHSITFGPEEPGAPQTTLPYNLGIEPFDAVAEVHSVNLLSRRADEQGRFQTYIATQLWSTLPARMVTQVARDFFSRRFANVERYPGSFVSDCILRAQLVRFEEVRGDEKDLAVVEIRYSLLVRENPGPETAGELRYRPLSGSGYEFVARGEEEFEGDDSLEDGKELALALRRAMEEALEKVWQAIVDRKKEFPRTAGKFIGP